MPILFDTIFDLPLRRCHFHYCVFLRLFFAAVFIAADSFDYRRLFMLSIMFIVTLLFHFAAFNIFAEPLIFFSPFSFML